MAENNQGSRVDIDNFDLAQDGATNDGCWLVNYLVSRLQQVMGNPSLQAEVQQQLQTYGILPIAQEEGAPMRPPRETSKRGKSLGNDGENTHEEPPHQIGDTSSPRRKDKVTNEAHPPRERHGSDTTNTSDEDVAPRRRHIQKSPTPPKRKRSPHTPSHHGSKRGERNPRKSKRRKRSPSSPSSSPTSSNESSGYSSKEPKRRGHRRSYAAWKRSHKLKKFKEGGKNITFLTYDGTFGATDKVLAFIQQFDAAFGDEDFTESSKLRHVAMHFQKFARQ